MIIVFTLQLNSEEFSEFEKKTKRKEIHTENATQFCDKN